MDNPLVSPHTQDSMFIALKKLYAGAGSEVSASSAPLFEDLQSQIKLLQELRAEEDDRPLLLRTEAFEYGDEDDDL